MLARQILRPARYAALTLLLSTIPSCDDAPAADDNKREIDWRYGPTTGAARSEHLQGTGTKGGKPIAEGWKCHLVDGKKLTVTPYHLAKSNPLFGDTLMILGLFDRLGVKDAEGFAHIHGLVEAIKQAIAAGTYESPQKLQAAIEGLLRDAAE